MRLKCVLIMAGGTGGHVFPGLAVAKRLRELGIEVHWLGTALGLESRLVPDAHFPFHPITMSGLRGKGIKTLLVAPLKLFVAIRQTLRVMRAIHPDVVIGMGGFVSAPGGIASWLARRPLIIHEQNAKAGLANKMLALFAKKVLTGFPSAFKPHAKVLTIGNPIRAELLRLPPPASRLLPIRSPFHLLVLGGSLGAQALNCILPRALAKLNANERPIVLHQTGDKNLDETKQYYESSGIDATLLPFIQDMAKVYAWADLVVCRAGALTVAELCAVGLGAIFVPFPYAVDDHQTANADCMVNENAALCVRQAELTEDRLADIVREFACSPTKRLAMAQAAYQLRRINVVERIIQICEEVCS